MYLLMKRFDSQDTFYRSCNPVMWTKKVLVVLFVVLFVYVSYSTYVRTERMLVSHVSALAAALLRRRRQKFLEFQNYQSKNNHRIEQLTDRVCKHNPRVFCGTVAVVRKAFSRRDARRLNNFCRPVWFLLFFIFCLQCFAVFGRLNPSRTWIRPF